MINPFKVLDHGVPGRHVKMSEKDQSSKYGKEYVRLAIAVVVDRRKQKIAQVGGQVNFFYLMILSLYAF